jgi:predicted pyridoxine 5'-phosphate oxidase superfamily flavin-nucleotide-binding protein
MSNASFYHEGSRKLQDQFDTRRLADRLEEHLVRDRIQQNQQRFIEGLDMFFLATADAQGQPTCSYKAGAPGFVRVVDDHTIAFPIYDGNGMYLSAGNALVNAQVGLLFIDFEQQKRLRLNGLASITREDDLLPAYPEAQFVMRVTVTQIFPNCSRYIHKFQRVQDSPFVPREDVPTPVPGWKSDPRWCDALPAHDPARHDKNEPAGSG